MRRAVAGAQLALGFLTVLPVRARTVPGGIGAAAAWFPAVGALIVDGLADCGDALGARGGREMRLAVMREATIGAFGAIALVLWALLLAAALGALPRGDALRTLAVAA